MAQRQNEIFVERIEHAKGKQVVLILAMNWIVLEIGQRVMHPAHVPFQAEPETTEMSWARNHRVGGGFFGVGLNVRMLFVGFEIEAAQKVDGFEVLASTELVGNPFPMLARVVEIEHRSDG